MTTVAARMTEPLVAMAATEGFLPRVDPYMLLEVVFEFERLGALGAFELPQLLTLFVGDQMALQPVHVCEGFEADLAALTTHRRSCVGRF